MNGARASRLLALAERAGTPAYAYLLDEVRANVARVREALPRFAISYAMKANPAPAVLAALQPIVDGIDVSSAGELDRALAAGFAPSRVGFTGPGKTTAELERALAAGIGEVVLESLDEATTLARLAERAGTVQPVLVRIAPDRVPPGFGDTMSGKPVAFGVDEEQLPDFLRELAALRALRLVGFHAYSGTQCLRPDSIAANWAIFARLFGTAAGLAAIVPQRLVFGAGMGIPYHDEQQPLDLAALAGAAAPVLDGIAAQFPRAQLVLETGRFLVGDAGVFLTRVVRTKDSRGARIGICDGGLNHHLAAAGLFGMFLRRNYRMHNLSAGGDAAAEGGVFQLSGPLCTSIDVLARDVALPRLRAGDVIAIEASGAYGKSASPGGFISHAPVREWALDGERVFDAASAAP